MTAIEMNAFRTTLETLQSELLGNGSRGRESLTVEASADDLDRLQSASERDYAISGIVRNSSRLREVRAALGRVIAREYGVCVGCGDDLKPKRLAAVPWASSCVACQEYEDLRQTAPFESLPFAA